MVWPKYRLGGSMVVVAAKPMMILLSFNIEINSSNPIYIKLRCGDNNSQSLSRPGRTTAGSVGMVATVQAILNSLGMDNAPVNIRDFDPENNNNKDVRPKRIVARTDAPARAAIHIRHDGSSHQGIERICHLRNNASTLWAGHTIIIHQQDQQRSRHVQCCYRLYHFQWT
jgi:hypothetical protein